MGAHILRAAALAGVRRAPAPLRRQMSTAMSAAEETSMQKLYPGFRPSWFGTPGSAKQETWTDTKNRWMVLEIYPLFAAIGLGCGICFLHCMRHMFFSKKNRQNAMIENHAEGAAWMYFPLRRM